MSILKLVIIEKINLDTNSKIKNMLIHFKFKLDKKQHWKRDFQFYVLAYDDGNLETRLTFSKMKTYQIM